MDESRFDCRENENEKKEKEGWEGRREQGEEQEGGCLTYVWRMDGLDANAPLNKNPTNEERWDATFQEKEGKRPRMRREEKGGTYLARTRTFAGMRHILERRGNKQEKSREWKERRTRERK